MRGKIIKRIAMKFDMTEKEVQNLVYTKKVINQYNTKIVKNRTIIDKDRVTLEEQVVLDYYKLLVNHSGIRFPNRSFIMSELMNIIPYLHLYKNYTIFKFDFKDFFYNICTRKNFEELNTRIKLNPTEKEFLKKYTQSVSSYTPGIGLHNSLIEISGEKFDYEIKKLFRKRGFLFYARYVDDCILILDEKINKTQTEELVSLAIDKTFGKKLELNKRKTQYANDQSSGYEIDYLGYSFQKGQSNQDQFKFGISRKKLEKYNSKIEEFVLEYKNSGDIEKLSFKLELFYKRIVFFGDKKGDKNYKWQVRGISDSYKELKRFINSDYEFSKITKDTKKLFNKTIEINFRKNGMPIPPKINNQIQNNKFISCFLNNKALLLHRQIGLNYQELKTKLELVHEGKVEEEGYSELAGLLLNSLN
ncbi:hypothetical protein [Bacillus sp. AK031]